MAALVFKWFHTKHALQQTQRFRKDSNHGYGTPFLRGVYAHEDIPAQWNLTWLKEQWYSKEEWWSRISDHHRLSLSCLITNQLVPSIGRKEIIMFFYLYMLVTIMDLLLISGIIPTASNLYPVRFFFFLVVLLSRYWSAFKKEGCSNHICSIVQC